MLNLDFIKQSKSSVEVLLFKNRLNKFSNQVSDYDIYDIDVDIIDTENSRFNPEIYYYDTDGKVKTYKAWGIVNSKYELLIGMNMEIKNGTQLFENLKFAIVSEKDLYKGE